MFDYWGSDVAEESIAELRNAGVKLLIFRPWRYLGSLSLAFSKVSRRNHRKSLTVDGVVGFTGGLNISNDYAAVIDGGAGWRDTHLRLVGPDAQALERLFLTTWKNNKGPKYRRHEVLPAALRRLRPDPRGGQRLRARPQGHSPGVRRRLRQGEGAHLRDQRLLPAPGEAGAAGWWRRRGAG